jgi:hypothetical protein
MGCKAVYLLIETWQNNGELKLLEAMETHDIHVIMFITEFIYAMCKLKLAYGFETSVP